MARQRSSRARQRQSGGREPPLAGLHVTLVEDNPSVATALERALLGLGAAAVTVAGTCARATAALDKGEAFDVWLVDVVLPDGNGVTVVKQIRDRERGRERRTAIVVMTGEAGFEVAPEAQRLDAALLYKPAGSDNLEEATRLALRLRDSGLAVLTEGSPHDRPQVNSGSNGRASLGDRPVLIFDYDAAIVRVNGRSAQLTGTMRDIVKVLREARDHAWVADEAIGKAASIAANGQLRSNVYKHVSRLRERLRAVGAEEWIERSKCIGYRRSPLWRVEGVE